MYPVRIPKTKSVYPVLLWIHSISRSARAFNILSDLTLLNVRKAVVAFVHRKSFQCWLTTLATWEVPPLP